MKGYVLSKFMFIFLFYIYNVLDKYIIIHFNSPFIMINYMIGKI